MGFCDECTIYIIPDEEIYDGPKHPWINFSVYAYQGRYEKMVWLQMNHLYENYANDMMK